MAEQGDKAQPRMDAARRRNEADEGGEDDKRHHPRLQQREVIAGRALAALAARVSGDIVLMSLIGRVSYLMTGKVEN